MPSNSRPEILNEIIEAHGGVRLWSSIEAVEAVISASGFLFTAKRRPPQNHVRVRAYTEEPRFDSFDFPIPGQRTELVGGSEVRIVNADGSVAESRLNPRAAFWGLRRLFYWDALDFVYFGSYAEWNYLLTPFIFLRDGFKFKVREHMSGIPDTWIILEVTFPDDLPTHCKNQTFYFDEDRLLRRLDYTAEVVGSWAKATHICGGYRDFNGFKVPTRRRVTPHLYGARYMPGPKLVSIDLHEFKPVVKG